MMYYDYLLQKTAKKELMLYLLFSREKRELQLPFPCAFKCFYFRIENILSCCLIFNRLCISLKLKNNSKPRENTELNILSLSTR